jgi:hypothetical protein
MNDNNSEELTQKEREALQSLAREMVPPAELEARVIRGLKRDGLIRGAFWNRSRRAAVAVAASLILFVSGYLTGAHQEQPASGFTMSESTYVLFLIQGPTYREASDPEQLKLRIEEYRNWARGIREEGIAITGVKLQPDFSVLGDGATGSGVSGYFLIEAKNLQQANALAASCPHLRYGGQVEIRRIHKV